MSVATLQLLQYFFFHVISKRASRLVDETGPDGTGQNMSRPEHSPPPPTTYHQRYNTTVIETFHLPESLLLLSELILHHLQLALRLRQRFLLGPYVLSYLVVGVHCSSPHTQALRGRRYLRHANHHRPCVYRAVSCQGTVRGHASEG